MNPLEYIVDSFADWKSYLLLLILSLVLHWIFLLKRRTLGFFDPLFFILLGSAFGWAIVWFMYLRGDIAGVYAISFTVAELAFYAGLYVSGRTPLTPPPRSACAENPGFAITVFGASAAMHVSATLATWAIAGIPLFRVSRLGAFVASGGLGILERLSDAGGTIALFTTLYLLIGSSLTRTRFLYYAFLGWYVLSIGLSGSKSAFLIIGQSAFAVAFLYTSIGLRRDNFWGGKAGKLLILVATAFALLVLLVQQGDDFNSALLGLVYRFVNFGDIYMYSYLDSTIEQLRGENALVGLFGGFLSTFRLFPVDQIHTNIGYQFTLLIFPDLDYVTGPNPRHPVFGYHYFGHLGFLFSFLLGVVTVHLQRALYFPLRRDFLRVLVMYLLYTAFVSVSADFDYSLSRVASFMIALCLVLPLALVMFPSKILIYFRHAAQ